MKRFLLCIFAVLTSGRVARATPKPLPFTYGADTNPKGSGEVEVYADFVPLKALDGNAASVPYPAIQFQTEVEYGLTNRLELGLYVTLVPTMPGFVQTPTRVIGPSTSRCTPSSPRRSRRWSSMTRAVASGFSTRLRAS